MSNFETLKAGQAVFLKRPAQIYAEVIGPRESDLGLPAEHVQYAVQLLPLEQHYLREDLETAHQPLPRKSQVSEASAQSIEDPATLNEADTKVSAADPFSDLREEINTRIARRAYELHEHRGFAYGHDGDDWLRAESEILFDVRVEVAKTDTQFIIRARLPGFSVNDIDVRVAPRSVCITDRREGMSEQSEHRHDGSERPTKRIFRVFELPYEIDPVRVTASLGDGVLEIRLPRAGLRMLVPVRAKSASA
jgi:HSP20 family molecular chaperone IbpA